VFAGTALAAAP
jgi:hypothetical protein